MRNPPWWRLALRQGFTLSEPGNSSLKQLKCLCLMEMKFHADCLSAAKLENEDAMRPKNLNRRLAFDVQMFARDVRGADKLALQAHVLKFGTGGSAYAFAKEVSGADIAALQARVLAVGDGSHALNFALNVPGADIQALQARVLALGEEWVVLAFARQVKGADIAALTERLVELRKHPQPADKAEAEAVCPAPAP